MACNSCRKKKEAAALKKKEQAKKPAKLIKVEGKTYKVVS